VKFQPALGGPAFWYVVFRRSSTLRWLDRIVPGPWKHVLAIGYFPDARCWIAIDPMLCGFQVDVQRREEAGNFLDRIVGDGGVLRVEARRGPVRRLPSFWCVPAIAAMVGSSSGALLPGGLWRDLVAEGAEIVPNDAETEGRP